MKKLTPQFLGPQSRSRNVRPSQPTASPSHSEPRVWVRDERGSNWVAAMIWLSILYLVVPSDYLAGRLPQLNELTEPSLLFRTIKLALIIASVMVIFWRAGLAMLLMRSVNLFFIGCLLLIALSFAWSITPAATIARTASLGTTTLVCFAFVLIGWHPHRLQNVLIPILTALLAGSIVFGLLFPELGIEQGEGTLKDAWRGLTYQKNSFGVLSSMSTIFWMHALLTRQKPLWAAIPGLLLSGTCVFLSRSSSSLLSTGLTITFMVVVLFRPGNMRRSTPYLVGTFATLVVVYALAVLKLVPGLDSLLTPVAEFFGKDTTFSNRSLIWEIIREHIQLHPALGTGYGAYWIGLVPSSPSYEFLSRLNFYPTESHNGYLEIVNDLGFIGLAMAIGYLIFFIRQSLQLMRVERSQAGLYLGIFFQQAIANLSESYWLQIGFGSTIFTLATLCTARAFLDHRLQGHFGERGHMPLGRPRG